MTTYSENRAWSDRYIPQIKRLIGCHLMIEAPPELDCVEATDLIIFTARDKRIAARVRRPGYMQQYRHEFTIRSRLDTGQKTEYAKIIDGFADWMFYGHAADGDRPIILVWMLIDLHHFRAALIRRNNGDFKLAMGDRTNKDGTYFKWFDVRSFPADPPLLVASEGLEL